MAVRPDYTTGTITLTSGSDVFATAGAALQSAAIAEGDLILLPDTGLTLVVGSITGENAGTLVGNCPAAAAGAGQDYRIRFQPDGSRYQAAARTLIETLDDAVHGLGVSVDGNLAMFDGTTGKVVEDSGATVAYLLNLANALGNLPAARVSGLGAGAAVNNLSELPGYGGTFTPTLTAQTPPTGVGYGALPQDRTGIYRRIGSDLVWFSLRILLTSVGTGGSGQILIDGLPVPAAMNSTAPLTTQFHLLNLSSGYSLAYGSVEIGSDTMKLREAGDNVSQQPLQWSALSATSLISLTGLYLGDFS